MHPQETTQAFICTACGIQYAPSDTPPRDCVICTDERQYVPRGGQGWTTLAGLRAKHRNAFQQLEPGLISIDTEPHFAIGQRAFLVRTRHGNVLWDCLALLDDATIEIIRALGGLHSVAISHPHYYTTMVEWGRAFDAPVLVHAADRRWVTRPDPVIRFWDGSTGDVLPGLRLIHCGGHFAGGAVLHWEDGTDGRGALLCGDVLQVVADTRYVSFMRSYPNIIPLSAAAVQRIAATVKPLRFERVYGAFRDREILQDGSNAVQVSARRYIGSVNGDTPLD